MPPRTWLGSRALPMSFRLVTKHDVYGTSVDVSPHVLYYFAAETRQGVKPIIIIIIIIILHLYRALSRKPLSAALHDKHTGK